MLNAMFINITIQALLTCLILYLAARYEADYDFQKILYVTIGLAVVNLLLNYALKPHIGWFCVFPNIAITALIFHDFCWLVWPRAFICACLLALLNTGATLGVKYVTNKLCAPSSAQIPFVTQLDAGLLETKQALENANRDEPVFELSATNTVMPTPTPITPATTAMVVSAAPPATTPEEWSEARAKLRLGGRIRGPDGRPVILIGGQVCAVGDLVVITHNDRRYTWRMQSITGKSFDLVPVGVTPTTGR